MRSPQRWPKTPEQAHLRSHVHLFGLVQTIPPRSKFIRKLYVPFLQRNIPPKAYLVNRTAPGNVTDSGVAQRQLPRNACAPNYGIQVHLSCITAPLSLTPGNGNCAHVPKSDNTLAFASLCKQSARRRTRQESASPRKNGALLTEPPHAHKASLPAKQRETEAT